MRAVISCNYEPMYLFCLPIVTCGWNKLGVGVDVVMPQMSMCENTKLLQVVLDEMVRITEGGEVVNRMHYFYVPTKNQEVTYTQCSRLYVAGALPQNDPNEIFVTSDVDMLVFDLPPIPKEENSFAIYGADLCPPNQYPICYIAAAHKTWLQYFCDARFKSISELLNDLLGDVVCENMRGNFWSKDQDEAYRRINLFAGFELTNRAAEGTQFAKNRCDRDDAFWAERFMNQKSFFDAHLWRPLYEQQNIEKLCRLIKMMYPQEPIDWILNYANNYEKAR
jgi:hypothetical protein